jgi:predicted permease
MIPDIKYGFRQLIKYPGFTAIAALTLALGIGVNTTMFSVMSALIFTDSKAPASERLVAVFRTSPQSQQWPHAPANFYDYQKQAASFEHVAAYSWNNNNLAEPGQPAERLPSMAVTGDFFTIFGIPPALGRTIGPDDDRPGVGRVAVLSDGFWRDHFASDPNVVGRSVRMDGQPLTIIGVMPPAMDNTLYWGHIDLWSPLAMTGPVRQNRDNNWMQIIGRLKPGVSLQQAQLEATAIAGRLAHDFPDTNAQNGLHLVSWNALLVGDESRKLSWLCMSLAGFVLLIACANLANLQLARMASRLREHAVRIALGATRLQLIRQLLVENILLSFLGGALGTLLAAWGTKLIGREILISEVPGYEFPMDTRVLVFTLIASVMTGLIVGLVPAWIASRADVNSALKQGSRGSEGGGSRHRLRQILVVSELALALMLLAGAGYFVRGMQRFSTMDTGWKPDGLITASMSIPFNANYTTDEQCRAFFDKLSRKLTELPGAKETAIAATLPITGSWRSGQILIEGRPIPPKGKETLSYYDSVTPGQFSTVGMRLISGRDFLDSDRPNSRQVAIINETMARVLWPGESAIGKRVREVDPVHENWLEVVGVVGDVHPTLELFRSLDTPFQIYLPLNQTESHNVHWLSLAIRSSAPQATVAAALRTAVQEIDPDQPVYSIISAREAMENVTRGLTLVSQILEVFALIGLALSSVGIYGVVANVVAQRTTEIGIRMALGAQEKDVLWMVLGQGMRLALIGTAIGLACSWGLVRLLNSMLPLIHGSDPVAMTVVATLLVAVALLACWLPARRATLVNPVVALRGD